MISFNIYYKVSVLLISIAIVLNSTLFIGCQQEKKSILFNEHDKDHPAKIEKFTGEKYALVDSVFLKEGREYISLHFLEYKIKSVNKRSAKIDEKFPDSVNIIETPEGFYISVKSKKHEDFTFGDKPQVTMQTLSHNQSGNYIFNEEIDLQKFIRLLSDKNAARYKRIPFKFTLIENVIMSVKEQYLP